VVYYPETTPKIGAVSSTRLLASDCQAFKTSLSIFDMSSLMEGTDEEPPAQLPGTKVL